MARTICRTWIVLLVLVCVSCTSAAPHSSENSKEQDIRSLMEATGGSQLAMQMMNAVIAQLKPTVPQVPDEFWRRFQESIHPGELVDLCVPIYDRHFSHEDIRGLLAFYSSPLGKKTIRELPGVMQESMAAGQEWGKKVAERVIRELREAGYSPSTS